jgi:hypothetical protein
LINIRNVAIAVVNIIIINIDIVANGIIHIIHFKILIDNEFEGKIIFGTDQLFSVD